jgi:WD40 repeat protein
LRVAPVTTAKKEGEEGAISLHMALRPRFRVFERSTPEPAHVVRAHEGQVHQLLFVSEDSFLSVGEDGQLLRIGIDGRVLHAFDGHGGSPVNCMCRIDGDRFATGGDDAMVQVWNLDGTCEQHLGYHDDFIRSVAAHGRLLVTVSEDRTIGFWDLEEASLLRTEPLTEEPVSVSISPDGSLVVVATLDNALAAFDAKTCEPRDPIYRSDAIVVHTGRLYLAMPNLSGVGHTRPPHSTLFLPDGTLISASDEILAWDPAARAQRLVYRSGWAPEKIVSVGDSIWLAANDLLQIDLEGRLRGWLPAPERQATAVGVSPEESWIAGASRDGSIHIFGGDVVSRDFDRHREQSRDLVLSWDGALAATTGSDNQRLVWSTATGEIVGRIDEPGMGSTPCAFTRD